MESQIEFHPGFQHLQFLLTLTNGDPAKQFKTLFSLSICPGFSFPPKTISPRTKETISDHIQQEQSITPTPLHWRPETGHLGVELMTGGNFSCLSLRPPDATTRPCNILYWAMMHWPGHMESHRV